MKAALTVQNDTRMESINSRETYAYGTSKEIIHKIEEINVKI